VTVALKVRVGNLFSEVAKDYPDVKVCKVNVDEEPELSNAFKIVSIPTIVVIKNGEIY